MLGKNLMTLKKINMEEVNKIDFQITNLVQIIMQNSMMILLKRFLNKRHQLFMLTLNKCKNILIEMH